MYSGTTLRRGSGNVMGTHQKIDRVARKAIQSVLPHDIHFPRARDILHFEGNNGPDGIKRKSPARDEPWHYFDPTDARDTGLEIMIEDHSYNLTKALKEDNYERASFEAAWLAHAIVDGLTPAHHYPLEEKLEELRGEPIATRRTVRDKIIIAGKGRRDAIRKNWEYWGAKGVMTTHFLFEMGVASTLAPLSFSKDKPNANERVRVEREGIVPMFREAALHIHDLGMYERFSHRGWTRTLARQTKQELAPIIIKCVALAWYDAARKAAEAKRKKAH